MVVDASEMIDAPVEKRPRSPSVPFIGLLKAARRARQLFERVAQEWVTLADAAGAWKLRPNSSANLQTVAALLAYGFAEGSGRGGTRRIRVSDLFATPLGSEAEQRALEEAALKPKLITHYAAKWRDGRPSDAICIGECKTTHRFTDAAAARFLKVFDEAMQFVGRTRANRTGKKPESGPELSDEPPPHPDELTIVDRDGRLEIKADVGLAGLHTLQEMLVHTGRFWRCRCRTQIGC